MDTVVVGLRVVLSLGVVLALLWVLQKRLVKGGRAGSRATSQVSVVARQGVGAKASVVVVDVEGERLVLGVTESSVTVLAAADRPVDAGALTLVPEPEESATESVTQEARVTSIAPVAFASVLSAEGAAARDELPARPADATPVELLRPRGAARRAAVSRPRDLDARRRGRTAKSIEGSILAPDTWRQAAAALRSGRAG
ncbi:MULTISPECIES: FliO/MopB family protein [unclassified Frigoribacterium]|uniref:FliO/MopB family protein n=1 Tax=unclassified Frigoribacterium TaxID=2627005 RepID=UPI0015670F7C|nr:flagellar biosynthetic protein FliO [Frigoribacterium sp. SL97]NQW87873.1 FliO/MopB family protein [Frigoribacterium sp. VKM Ac-2860]NQX09318.1 FliO/MopB family protein [Frigoribacterium sp. VKM Ac-2859]WAC52347.1 flagellar biosynthetic protein FliO [Frigoribacterium sp. SL97]